MTSPTDGPEPDAPVRVVERPALDRELDLGAPVVVRASPGVLTTRGGWSSEVQSSSALEAVPALVAAWVLGSGVMAAVLALSGIWSRDPEAALALSLGAGVAVVAPRKLWAAPLVVAGTGLAGMVLSGMDWPAIVGAGAAAGLARPAQRQPRRPAVPLGC